MRLANLPAVFAGDNHGLRTVRIREGSRVYVANVPNDSLWTAVKDNLILHEYERAGISLSDCRRVVVDAGAHVGLFSLRAAQHASKVIALEAHPINYKILTSNLETNSLNNVQPLREALWSTSGEIEFLEGSHSAGGSILGGEGQRFRTPSVTLASIISLEGDIDLLKLDIEGAEFPVLEATEDAVLGRIRSIVGELHVQHRATDREVLIDRLESLGFEVTILMPPVQSVRDSLRRTLASFSRVRGVLRLQLTILTVYSLFGVLRRFSRRFRELDSESLNFLYAVRRDSSPTKETEAETDCSSTDVAE
jgi:FkbM family methyltransferase